MTTYSAGTAYLVVVPSFKNIEGEFRREVERMGREMDKTISASLGHGIAEAAKNSGTEGEKAGAKYAGAFGDNVLRRLDKAYKALPTIPLKTDDGEARQLSDVEQRIVSLGKKIKELRDTNFGPEFDSGEFLRQVEHVRTEAEKLGKEKIPFDLQFNLRQMVGELDSVRQLARTQGGQSGEAWAGAFETAIRKHLGAASKALPLDVKVKDPGLDGELARIREHIQKILHADIDIDMRSEDVLPQLLEIRAALKSIADTTVDVKVRSNARTAESEITSLITKIQGAEKQVEEVVPDKKKGAEQGAAYGGAYGAAVSKAITAGLREIPQVEIKADSSYADRQIDKLRTRLLTLGNAKIGVDMDAGKVQAEITAILAELKKLARSETRIDVRTNLLATAAELQAFQGQLDRIDGRNVNVEIGTGGLRDLISETELGMSRLGFLISIGASLGTAIVPAAAAAAAAVGAIATAAAAAGLGVGVAILGLSGVVGAVQALDKYQKDSTKSAVSLAQAENRVASARDQLASAQDSVASATDAVASAHQRVADAIYQVGEAQKTLTRAEREAKDAVDALTRAREDAQRELQDLTYSLEENSLAQRQAQLDAADAKKELDKLLANPRATEQEREQARITYEEKALQLQELATQQQRLAADKAAADKKGVEGSDKVVQAQQRVADSNEAVARAQRGIADAQRGVVDAQKGLAQSERGLEASQRGLAAAQRGLAQAYDKTGVAGGAAFQNVETAMAGLSPAGQKFARFIFGLKSDFKELQFAAEKGLLPGLEQGIRSLLPQLPGVERLVSNVAGALGNVFVKFADSLKSPIWQTFFRYISSTAVPVINGLYEASSNVARGIAGLYLALTPFNKPIGKGLISLTQDFARWATTLSGSSGYAKFLDYVRQVGPRVIDLFGSMAKFIGRIVEAAAPIGALVVNVFDDLFHILNQIPLPVLAGLIGLLVTLATVYLTVSAAQRAYKLATDLADIAVRVFARGQQFATTVMNAYQTSLSTSTIRTGRFTGALNTIQAGTSAAKAGLSGLVGMLGGPWGIAITGATLLIARFVAAQQDIKEKADSMVSALSSIANAYTDGGDVAVLALARQDKAVAQAIGQLRELGLTSKDVFEAQGGDVEAQKLILDGLKRKLEEVKAARQKLLDEPHLAFQPSNELNDLSKQMEEIQKVIDGVQSEYDAANRAASQYGQTIDDLTAASKRAQLAQDTYGQKISDLEGLYDRLTSKELDAASAADDLRKYTEQATGAAVTATEAEEARVRSLLDLKQTLADNGKGLDLHAAKNDADKRAILANRDALEDALRAAREKTLADIAAKVPIDEATKASHDRIRAILDEIPATQRNTSVVQDLIKRYGEIPDEVTTQLKTTGAQAILQQLADLKVAQYALEHDVSIDAARSALKGQLSTYQSQVPAQARAMGGLITGPGGPTDDRIPAWLSNGEYVIPTWLVNQLGVGFFDQLLASRGGTRGNVLGSDDGFGFRNGGPVVVPIKVDVSKTKMPFTMAQLEDRYASSPSGVVPGGLGYKRMEQILLSQFPNLGIFSDYRPGAITVTGNRSYHSVGRAVDMSPRRDVFEWIRKNYPNSRELIFSPMGMEQIWNGRPHIYSDPVKAEHYNHVHWAYDQGGMLPPGYSTVFNGTGQPEPVLTSQQWNAISSAADTSGGGNTYNFAFRDTTLTPEKLHAIQERDDVLNRVGRPR